MPLILRRLLNYLPFPTGRGGRLVVRSSWHKPTPFDQWRSQAPFQAKPMLGLDRSGRTWRRRQLAGVLLRWTLIGVVAWILTESVRAVLPF